MGDPIPIYRSCPPAIKDPDPCIDKDLLKERMVNGHFVVYREDLLEALKDICSWIDHVRGTLEHLPPGFEFKLPEKMTPRIPGERE